MPPVLSQGSMLWESLPWESVLRASCPRQRLQSAVAQNVQRAFKSRWRPRDAKGRILPELTDKQREMQKWLAGPGKIFENPAEDSTNYLSAYDEEGNLIRGTRAHQIKILEREQESGIDDKEREKRALLRRKNTSPVTGLPRESPEDLRPFPLNKNFRSEPVLSEELRDIVYQRVTELKGDISAVSAAYSIDLKRVAAVVRLKAIEERWKAQGKKLAKPYNDAVLAMLPQTPAPEDGRPHPHESINDLSVHAATRNQLWVSTPESRKFTRQDAAKAFAQNFLPADDRINHPKLIQVEKWALQGLSVAEQRSRILDMQAEEQEKKALTEAKRRHFEERTTRVVSGKRWDFKFRNTSVEWAGSDGRGVAGVGVRYGMPHDDRKKGKYKLPKSVE